MKITCISDLHGYYPKLDGGELLIVAGDLTGRDTDKEHLNFIEWLVELDYKKKIYIAGNHDGFLDPKTKRHGQIKTPSEWNIEYLCDSGTEFEGLKIWGSPWTKTFIGMNPKCKAFTCETEEELAQKWKLIPEDTDILITHTPPFGILDGIPLEDGSMYHVGSKSLRRIIGKVKPILWVCAHIHEGYGQFKDISLTGIHYHFVNASYVNEYYKPINNPVKINL